MSFGKVANCLFIIFVAFANGMPQNEGAATEQTSGSLPFLQFTNGGVRVNFAGYHAEAGLGGSLGSGLGGGLHASAGTPWGAHAGAGLGGQLGSKDASAGGGLFARAGLGNGRPEAAAGLGGRLDGSGRSLNPISGGMYAGATPGFGPGAGVYLGGGLGEEGIDVAASGTDNAGKSPQAAATVRPESEKPARGRTNIQIIPSKNGNAQKRKEKVAVEAAALPADAPTNKKVESQTNEVRRAIVAIPPIAKVGVFGTISGAVETAPLVKSVEKNVIATVPVVAVAANAVPTNTNVVATVDNNPDSVVRRPAYPRWYFRKRFWTVPRKVVYVSPTSTDSQDASSDVVGGLYVGAVGDGAVVASKPYVSGSLFDDIFNIPISALTAVNQLLRNNVG